MSHNQHALLRQISELIDKSPDISLPEIARAIKVERHAIEMAVRRVLDLSHREWRLTLSIRKAEEYLITSNLGIKEIAGLCGYESVSAFSRAFRKKRGFPPARFRGRFAPRKMLF